MKTKRVRTYIFPMIAMLLLACSRGDDNIVHEHLSRLDAMLDEQPQAVSDSLKRLNPESLSRGNRAYFGLLKTISGDKTYTEFTSDSLINGVERYYNRHGNGTDAHIRSLVYQGIVRYRMGITDSTMLIPLKQAEHLFKKRKELNPSIGYLMNYYLGEILEVKNDKANANKYYKTALSFAQQEKNDKHRFDAYLTLFWNEMMQENSMKGKLYLDTLNSFTNLTTENTYFLLNAESVYYNSIEEYNNALEAEKQQLKLLVDMPYQIDKSKIYYSISDRYSNLMQLDSALYYAKLSVNHITDSTYKLNYLLYQNVADIAEKQHDYSTANQYRKNAAEIRDKNIEHETDKSLLELERKYNLTEAENKTLKAQQQSRLFIAFTLIAILLAILFYLYFSKQRTLAAARNQQLEAEKREAQTRALLIQQRAETQEQMLGVYGSFLQQYALQQQSVREMAAKVRSKNSALADRYEENLKELNRQFAALTARMFTPEKLQEQLHLSSVPLFLNQSDCLTLFMLAAGTENVHIASLLNTTPETFKVRKAKLKKKITAQTNAYPDVDHLLKLF